MSQKGKFDWAQKTQHVRFEKKKKTTKKKKQICGRARQKKKKSKENFLVLDGTNSVLFWFAWQNFSFLLI